MEPYEAIADGWLQADREVPRKQRHTGRSVWQRGLMAGPGRARARRSRLGRRGGTCGGTTGPSPGAPRPGGGDPDLTVRRRVTSCSATTKQGSSPQRLGPEASPLPTVSGPFWAMTCSQGGDLVIDAADDKATCIRSLNLMATGTVDQ